MIETQVLMTVSDVSGFFLGIISWKEASLFNGGLFFSCGGFIFKLGDGGHLVGGIRFEGGGRGVRKKS